MPMDRLTRASLGRVPPGPGRRRPAPAPAAWPTGECRSRLRNMPNMSVISLLAVLIGHCPRGGARVPVRPQPAGKRRHGGAGGAGQRGRGAGTCRPRAGRAGRGPARRAVPGAVGAGARCQHPAVPGDGRGQAGRAANAKAAGDLDTRRVAVEHLVGPLKDTLAPGGGPAPGGGRGAAAVARRAGRAGAHRPAELRAAAGPDPGAGHRAAAAGGARAAGARCSCAGWSSWPGMSARCDFDEQVVGGH